MPESSDNRYDAAIGQRIQAIRLQRGLTQQGLAQRAHVSYSSITKVESGHRAATPTLTAACARALRVPVTDLTGQPYFDALKRDQMEELIQPIRHAIANPMLPVGEVSPRDPEAIRADVVYLDEARLRGQYMEIGTIAPALIDELLHLAHTTPEGREREKIHGTLAHTYRMAHAFVYKLGFLDLALLALDRMEQAASLGPDPYLAVVVCHYRSNYFLHHGAYDIGLREIATMEESLTDPVRRGDPRALSLMGTMHLKAAVMHSRRRRPTSTTDVAERIGEARELAGRLADQPDPYGLTFDRPNVEIHATSTKIDLGDVGGAAEHGEQLRLPGGWALNRSGHHHMDMARAYEKLGRPTDALQSLMAAKVAAPVQTRYHPTTRETVLALLRRHRTPSRELSGYARWVGV
ncbi:MULTISPECIES: helix-turn-helix domain-containing protein [Streptomyces]|uniref:Transcriptional regulator, contains XRE-family HTH domain n=1 Tax=Streptomyces harbinensis TaxID=1176198 RepID=A0A1I6VBC1_9ACTN|nr:MULTISPECIES: helix-turn-helix transcriptional regulator [Streptomyces]SFT11026.1 Transcriptional regulator, contains XRE-family HTH domain [Streptomyces harbinensis]